MWRETRRACCLCITVHLWGRTGDQGQTSQQTFLTKSTWGRRWQYEKLFQKSLFICNCHSELPESDELFAKLLYSIFSLKQSSVQFSHSAVSNSLQPHGQQARQASLFNTSSQSLLTLMSIESVMPSNHLILCWPLLLPTAIFPSIRVLSNESVLHIRWPKD